jgi:hypothetical protein
MTRQMIQERPDTRDGGYYNPPGNTSRNRSLSVLWELFHDTPSLPPVAVAGTLLHSWE